MQDDDWNNWNTYYKHVDLNKDLSEDLRSDSKKAISTYRHFLGENWLESAEETNHPLYWQIRGIEGGSNLATAVKIANSISTLKDVIGFDNLFSRLRLNLEYSSAVAELELAYRLMKNKAIIELSPLLNGKRPDVLCDYGGINLAFEAKSMGPAVRTRDAQITVARLSSYPEIRIHPCGKVFKIMKGTELEETKKIVVEKCQDAIRTKMPVECFIPGKVKFLFVPPGLKEKAKIYQEWCDKQEFFNNFTPGQKGGLLFPDDKVRQEVRAKKRLFTIKKEGQLPDNNPGIVFLDTSEIYLWRDDDIDKFIVMMNQYGSNFKNIVALVVYTTIYGFENLRNKIIHGKTYSLITNYSFDALREDLLIINNPFCRFNLDKKLLTTLLS